jgi:hypothetical protein
MHYRRQPQPHHDRRQKALLRHHGSEYSMIQHHIPVPGSLVQRTRNETIVPLEHESTYILTYLLTYLAYIG